MKSICFLLPAIFFSLQICRGIPLDEKQLAVYREKFRTAAPQARIAAMEEFTDTAFRGFTGDEDEHLLLPLLASLLADPEAKIRRRAAECSAAIAYANLPKSPRPTPPATDLNSCPPWQNALRAALRDSDARMRDSALSAYALAFPVMPDIQDELVEHYDADKAAWLTLKTKVPFSLLIDNAPTPRAVALLERLADTPDMCIQLAQMLRDFGKVPPGGLLPRFVRRMREEDDPNRRDTYFFAIVEYRQQTKPYLEDLQKVRQLEPSPITRQNMDKAIRAVEESH